MNMQGSHLKTFSQVQDQGRSRWTTTVIVSYFEDWPPRSNAACPVEALAKSEGWA